MSTTESVVGAIWAEILGLESDPNAEASFIDLGGESLSAELVAMRIRNEFHVPFSGSDVLQYSVLKSAVEVVDQRKA